MSAMTGRVQFGKAMRKEFLFDDGYLNLNHGTVHFLEPDFTDNGTQIF